jgi:hypothetical protein
MLSAARFRITQVRLPLIWAVRSLTSMPMARTDYRRWLTYGEHRAFAISADGSWGASSDKPDLEGSTNAASERALYLCRRTAKEACDLYAIDHQVIWQRHNDIGTSE